MGPILQKLKGTLKNCKFAQLHGVYAYLVAALKILSSKVSVDSDINYMSAVKFLVRLEFEQIF